VVTGYRAGPMASLPVPGRGMRIALTCSTGASATGTEAIEYQGNDRMIANARWYDVSNGAGYIAAQYFQNPHQQLQ
jgi:hypothetical protein